MLVASTRNLIYRGLYGDGDPFDPRISQAQNEGRVRRGIHVSQTSTIDYNRNEENVIKIGVKTLLLKDWNSTAIQS